MLRYPKEDESPRFDEHPCVRSVIQIAYDAIDLARKGIFGQQQQSTNSSVDQRFRSVALPPPALSSSTTNGNAGQGRSMYGDGRKMKSRRNEEDDEELTSLVDVAVDGLKETFPTKDSRPKPSKRPGGETYTKPPVSSSSSRTAVVSESYKTVQEEGEEEEEDSHESDRDSLFDARADSAYRVSPSKSSTAMIDFNLTVCRQEEAKLFSLLKVCLHASDAERILKEAETKNGKKNHQVLWYLIDGNWWREWSAFVKGGPNRPTSIVNENLLSENDSTLLWSGCEPGKSFIGLDARGWGVLVHLYGADVSVVAENNFPTLKDIKNEKQKVVVRRLEVDETKETPM